MASDRQGRKSADWTSHGRSGGRHEPYSAQPSRSSVWENQRSQSPWGRDGGSRAWASWEQNWDSQPPPVTAAVAADRWESSHSSWEQNWDSIQGTGSWALPGGWVLKRGVGFLGKKQVVVVVHFNNNVANKNKGFADQQKRFLNDLVALCEQYEASVLMGDFNMSFFEIVPAFRSRGKNINLGAWYPWKSTGETIAPCADSCGIFILTPAVCTLAVGLAQLHEDDAQGIISNDYLDGDAAHVRDPQAHPNRIYDIIEHEGGPGQELGCYLKKLDGLEEKLTPSLTCVNNTDPAARGEEERRKALLGVSEMDCRSRGGTHVALAVREKRLQATLWRFKGENHKGSHFPVCCFTDNMGRRTDDGEKNGGRRRQRRGRTRGRKSRQGHQRQPEGLPQLRQEGLPQLRQDGRR